MVLQRTPKACCENNPHASRQTELAEEFPAHVVSSWLGNTERVAAEHYLQVLDSHFEKAARIPARTASESNGTEMHRGTENAKHPCFQGVLQESMGVTGLEPVTSTV